MEIKEARHLHYAGRLRNLRDYLLASRTTYWAHRSKMRVNPEYRAFAKEFRAKGRCSRVTKACIELFWQRHGELVAEGYVEPNATWDAADWATKEHRKRTFVVTPRRKRKSYREMGKRIFDDMKLLLSMEAMVRHIEGGTLEEYAMGYKNPVKRERALRLIAEKKARREGGADGWRHRHGPNCKYGDLCSCRRP